MEGVVGIDRLAAVLSPGSRELISIVGGGGKTTTLFALGAALGPRVVMTTTTKMGSERDEGHPVLLDPTDEELVGALDDHGRVLVWKARGDHRSDGVTPEDCDRWFTHSIADHVVVEADGSRRRPFKAPYPYEPVVPAASTLLIACIGAEALGRPIGEVCHRADAVVVIVGGSEHERLTPAKAALVLQSDDGSRRGLPPEARYVVVVHQVTDAHRRDLDALRDHLGGATELIAVAATDRAR